MRRLFLLLALLVLSLPARAAESAANTQLRGLQAEARRLARESMGESGGGGASRSEMERAQEWHEVVSAIDQLLRARSDGEDRLALREIPVPTGEDRFSSRLTAAVAAFRKEREEEIRGEAKALEAEIVQARTAVAKAKRAPDLDGALEKLGREIERLSRLNRHKDTERLRRVQRALAGWQEYLAWTEAGQAQSASQTLERLVSDQSAEPLLPRSELLKRRTPPGRDSSEQARAPATPKPDYEATRARIRELLAGIRKLADLDEAVPEMQRIIRDLPGNQEFYPTLNALAVLHRGELARRVGALIGPPDEYPSNEGSPYTALRLRLRDELTLAILPVYFQLKGPEFAPQTGKESVPGYIERVIRQLKEREEWATVMRVGELAAIVLRRYSGNYTPRLLSDFAVAQLVAGDNLAAAGEFKLAALSYLQAVRLAGESMPLAALRKRLEQLRTAQPAACEAAAAEMARSLAPVPAAATSAPTSEK